MKKIFTVSVLLIFSLSLFSQTIVKNLLCENSTNPIGIDITVPRFSWQLSGNQRNLMQAAYQIRVTGEGPSIVWLSDKIPSSQSVFVPYSGKALESGKRYSWQVKVWDNYGKASAWSGSAFWEMGLLKPDDWKAKWIRAGYEEDSVMRPSPMFRKQFSAAKKIKSARAYITSHGLYEAFINGRRVGDSYLTPGWTSYNKRLQYQVHDITSLLTQGNNVVGVVLGSGWYRGHLAWEKNKNVYGKQLGLLLQFAVTYVDGSVDYIISDESWRSSTGPIQYSEIYHGEINDARLEKNGWMNSSYDDSKWSHVEVKDLPKSHLLATRNEHIKKHEQFPAKKIFKTPKGELLVDFGQNMVGFVQMKLTGKAGDSIKLYHAEVLDKAGNFYTENLRVARQENIYILKGQGTESFEPHFTFQGFRYVKVVGFTGELKPENISAVALYSDMQPTGSFTSSNALINQLQHNIQWGQKGNFLDVPTDCPQRDERLGWTGDAQVFARTAAFNMDVHNFFGKWLKDLEADQTAAGSIPFVVPNVLGENAGGSAGWADAGVIIPWTMYINYGDTNILHQQYNSMKNWIGYMQKNSTDYLWNKGFHFGDWLFYRPGDDNDGRAAVTDKYLISQCFFAHSTQLMLNTARVLGKTEDVNIYSQLLTKIKEAFLKEYTTPSGRLVSSTQTAYVLALHFDMLPESLRKQAAERLAQNVKDYNNHLTTGFLGTPYLCHVLSRFGYTDVAYSLLMQETYPSWLYPVKMGATTIWERWDGQKPDSTFQTPGMNSFNHYAYGAIGDWMYRVVAGIDTHDSTPGYKRIRIKPHIGGKLTSAAADYRSNYGMISSHWSANDKKLQFHVEIPANTMATVYIPAANTDSVMENNKSLTGSKEIKLIGKEGDYVIVELGSGKYSFSSTL
ncbi:MAG: family 78 glycoside hydrolase catalytic domain [Chitinophagaceae bacterium]|nr:family 78 glycoside hydrolase catalytic domain [Chitinophagaceae bacterium]